MAKDRPSLFAFNRGEIGKLSLGRIDVERLRLGAETQENFVPYVTGPMSLRPGLRYIASTKGDLTARLLPFVFANSDTALLELTGSVLRVFNLVSGTETLVSRPSVSTAVTSGTFDADTGWSLTTRSGGSSSTVSGGQLRLSSPSKGGYARATQTLTVAGGDLSVEHALRITVARGPVLFKVGSTSGGEEYISETTLNTGVHSLAFTPTATSVYLAFETRTAPVKLVDSIAVESSGTMEIPTPWGASVISLVRYAQSGDIVFCACEGVAPYQIERRSTRSWSVVKFKNDDGPFANANSLDVKLTPAALTGNTTLTSNRNFFEASHIGSLIRIFSMGQTVVTLLSEEDTWSEPIRVSGVGDAARSVTIARSGTWSGELRVERSYDSATSGFQLLTAATAKFTSNGSFIFEENITTVAWYRVGFPAGLYGSGTATVTMTYSGGGGAGIGRITSVNSPTSANVEVVDSFASLRPSDNFSEGDWSDLYGWPSSVAFHDGRLWWAGRDKVWGSVSDSYYSHDIDKEGDAGPINRSVGFGPIDTVNWLLPLSRLIVGREGAETSVRSSSLDEPLTPTNFSMKDCSTQGSAAVQAVKIDSRGIFVQRSERRVYELAYSGEGNDYSARDLTRLNLDIGEDLFSEIGVQRQPDTLVHFVRGDGECATLLYERDDQVEAWWRIVTDGDIEACAVLPAGVEDAVYFVVNRTINGNTVRYIERMARRDQCLGQPEARLADSHYMYSGSAVTTITGLSHLEGESVVVWGWNTTTPFTATLPDDTTQTVGKSMGTFTVSSGQITGLASAVTDACVGLSYTGKFKSSKLAYAAAKGTALVQIKKIDQIGLLLADTHSDGLEYGIDFTTMDALPLVEDGDTVEDNVIWVQREIDMTGFPGEWDTDSRLCLRATAPKPCTVLGAVIDITTHG